MSGARGSVLPAVVIRLSDYGEADRVVTLLTSSQGKLSTLARGARKSGRRFGGLTLFAVGEATVVERARASLDLLDGFHAARGLPRIVDDIASIAHAGYACELVDGLVAARQPEPEVFASLLDFLSALDARGAAADRLRAFELRLLGLLGFSPTLDRCLDCGRVELDEPGQLFDALKGGVVCAHCRGSAGGQATPLDGAARRALLVANQPVQSEFTDPDVDRACRAALSALVTAQLGHVPRSLTFIAKLNRPR